MQSNNSSPIVHLGQAVLDVFLLVARILQRLGRGGFDVRQPVLREAPQVVAPRPVIAASMFSSHCSKRAIAARLQQVGAGGHRQRAAREDRRDVQRVRARGVGYTQVAVELVRQLVEQVHRDRIERPARHVHLVARHARLVVVHRQRVAQLDAEGQVLAGGRLPAACGSTPAPSRTSGPSRTPSPGCAISVKPKARRAGCPAPASLPSSVGFILTTVCSPRSFQQIAGDALDLVGRAAVHRGEGDAVGEFGRGFDDRQTGGTALSERVLDLGEVLGGVGHLVHEVGHARALDAFQVVAHAHVEDAFRRGPRRLPTPAARRRTWIAPTR